MMIYNSHLEGDGAVWRVVELDDPAVERLRGPGAVVGRQHVVEEGDLLLADLPHLAEDVPDHVLRARRRGQGPVVPEVAARPLLQRPHVDQPRRHLRVLVGEVARLLGKLVLQLHIYMHMSSSYVFVDGN
jgi:hypothetical protein